MISLFYTGSGWEGTHRSEVRAKPYRSMHRFSWIVEQDKLLVSIQQRVSPKCCVYKSP